MAQSQSDDARRRLGAEWRDQSDLTDQVSISIFCPTEMRISFSQAFVIVTRDLSVKCFTQQMYAVPYFSEIIFTTVQRKRTELKIQKRQKMFLNVKNILNV